MRALTRRGRRAVIASKRWRGQLRKFDRHSYKAPHGIENFCCRLKHVRNIAARYESTANISLPAFSAHAPVSGWFEDTN